MPATLSYPGVYIEEIPSGVHGIAGVATSIGAFIGWAPQGPTNRAYLATSWADYARVFGGLARQSYLSYAVYQFFLNGGQQAYIIRLVGHDADHPDDPAKNATAATATVGGLKLVATGEGTWADSYKITVTPRAADATRFGVQIFYSVPDPNDNSKTIDTLVESFDALSTDPNNPRYAKSVLTEESMIVNTVDPIPNNVTSQTASLAHGQDGPTLDPVGDSATFVTSLDVAGAGSSLLAGIDLFNLLCVPGLTDAAALEALLAICDDRRAFLIADSPHDATIANLSNTGPNITGRGAPNGAFYFPWVNAPDPLQQNRQRAFPPSGFVAGIYARTDTNRGVWKAPAGTEAALSGVYGAALPMSDVQNGNMNIRAVNCIRTFPVYGTVVWGARTLVGSNDQGSEWKYVPVRRMALFLEESLYRGLKWVVFEPNDESLWSAIRMNVTAFMQGLFRLGAFQGTSPREAYFVKCDKDTTTPADINLGVVNIVVGFAPLRPAEFVVVQIQQMAGEAQV